MGVRQGMVAVRAKKGQGCKEPAHRHQKSLGRALPLLAFHGCLSMQTFLGRTDSLLPSPGRHRHYVFKPPPWTTVPSQSYGHKPDSSVDSHLLPPTSHQTLCFP
jgi:hypothetical protein